MLAAVRRDIVEGFAAVRRHPALRGLLFLPAGWALGTGAARILYSLYGATLGLETMGELVRNPRDLASPSSTRPWARVPSRAPSWLGGWQREPQKISSAPSPRRSSSMVSGLPR